MKPIKGEIPYELSVDDKGWSLTYKQGTENDLASLAISRQIIGFVIEEYEKQSASHERADKRAFYKKRLEKMRAAKFALGILCEDLVSVMDDYKKFMEENLGQDKLTPEQQEELSKMMAEMNKPKSA